MADDSSIEAYYERNTRRFLRFGGGAASGAIHRQLWGPGVTSVGQAARFIHRELAAAIAESSDSAPVVLDLGCGVGGTAIHLARALPGARVHGVTISATQALLARAAADRAAVAERCAFHTADFEQWRADLSADAGLAIESFVHARAPEAFFATAATHIAPGGRLFVIDDFLRDVVAADDARIARLATQFRRGWRVPSFMPADTCIECAAAAGFELAECRDLSGLIRLDRFRDRLIAVIAPACDALGLSTVPFFGNLIGGNALNAGLGSGAFRYLWLSFRRRA